MATQGSVVPNSALVTPGGDQGPAGSPGPAGSGGSGGGGSTTVSASFVVPPVGQTVVATFVSASWLVPGEVIWIGGAGDSGNAGSMTIQSINGNQVTLVNTPPPGVTPLASTTGAGYLTQLSGNTTDYVDGTNHCSPIAPQVWSVRTRSFNAIGNPNYEVDQRNVGQTVSLAAGSVTAWIDRWVFAKNAATGTMSVGQAASAPQKIPGINFAITSRGFTAQVVTPQATLAAGEYLYLSQAIEGSRLRELISDVTSIQLLCYCSSALSFSISLHDGAGPPGYSLVYLCSIPANTPTLVQVPNIPIWPSGGTFPLTPGSLGYVLSICLGAGSTYVAPAAGSWQTGNFLAAPGAGNFLGFAANSTFSAYFVQHEPGSLCSGLIDVPFAQNLQECLRYYCKTFNYGVKPGTNNPAGCPQMSALASQNPIGYTPFPKRMAKAPTVTGYSGGSSGAVNAVYDAYAAVDRGISSWTGTGDNCPGYPLLATTNTAATIYAFHFTADTSW